MKILRKMAGFFAPQRIDIRDPDSYRQNGARVDSGEFVSSISALGLSAVWACVNLLCGTNASLPVMVYKTNAKGERELDKSHPLYRLLHDSPNYDQTAVDFWEYMSAALELRGNAYAKIERNGDRVIALRPINPACMSVRRTIAGPIEYRWTQDGKSYVENDGSVLHIRGFGGDPLGGMSTLEFGRSTFGLAQAIDRSAGSMFRNGLRPFFQVVFDKWLTPEQRELAETRLVEKYAGAVNAGKPYIAEGGAKLESLSLKPEDAQMLQSRAFSVEEICRFFGVPPFMIGHTEKSTSWGTGIEQQTLGFQKFTLRRRLKRIEQALEKQLLTPEDRARGVSIEFNLEGLLRADSAGRAAFYRAALGDTQKPGWMVRNEVRRLENMAPIDGWDEPVQLVQQAASDDEDALRQLISEMIAEQRGQSQ